MSGAQAAYSSGQPSVLLAWEEAQRRLTLHGEALDALMADYPDWRIMGRKHPFGGGRLVTGLKGEDSPGEGWRLDAKEHIWVPDRRTTAGKEHAERLSSLSLSLPEFPGMPDLVLTRYSHVPGFQMFDGEVWATWACTPDLVAKGGWSKVELDPSIWTERALSEYYSREEAAA